MFTINKHPKSMTDLNTNVPSGFAMTFENGNTISVQFGFGNYASNINESKEYSMSAEITIWSESDKCNTFDNGGQFKGYCSADEVAKWIEFAANNEI